MDEFAETVVSEVVGWYASGDDVVEPFVYVVSEFVCGRCVGVLSFFGVYDSGVVVFEVVEYVECGG